MVQPHYLTVTQNNISSPAGSYGALIIRPDLENTRADFIPDQSSGQTLLTTIQMESFEASGNFMSFGTPLNLGSGKTAAAVHIPFAGWDRFGINGGHHSGELVYHPGTYEVIGPVTAAFYNFDGAPADVNMFLAEYDGTSVVNFNIQNATISGKSQHTFTFLVARTYTNLVIGFQYQNPEILGHIFEGSSVTGYAGLNYISDGHWSVTSMLDIIDSTAIKAQYAVSDYTSITAMSAVLTNVTPELSKGGTIALVQLPASSFDVLPRNPQQLYSFITRLTHKNYSGPLEHGASWNYVPEKIQDMFFKPSSNEPEYSVPQRPYLAIAWHAPGEGTNISATELTLRMDICYEYLTTDISSPLVMSLADPHRFYELYLAYANMQNNVGCNPDHLKRIKDAVVKIASNPYVREAALNMLKFAGKEALSALPMLL